MLSKQAKEAFKKCWQHEFNEEISDQQAQEQGVKLLRLFSLIYRPISKSWLEEKKKDIKRRKKV